MKSNRNDIDGRPSAPCSPSSLTPETDGLLINTPETRANAIMAMHEVAEHAREMEYQRNEARAMEQKYASELQTLCDLIIGGTNATAPFNEVKQRLLEILPENTTDQPPQ